MASPGGAIFGKRQQQENVLASWQTHSASDDIHRHRKTEDIAV